MPLHRRLSLLILFACAIDPVAAHLRRELVLGLLILLALSEAGAKAGAAQAQEATERMAWFLRSLSSLAVWPFHVAVLALAFLGLKAHMHAPAKPMVSTCATCAGSASSGCGSGSGGCGASGGGKCGCGKASATQPGAALPPVSRREGNQAMGGNRAPMPRPMAPGAGAMSPSALPTGERSLLPTVPVPRPTALPAAIPRPAPGVPQATAPAVPAAPAQPNPQATGLGGKP